MLDALHAARDWLDAVPHIKSWLIGAWLAYLAGLGMWIVLQKREPAATLSWLLSLAALPYIGFLIYFLLGPQKIKRQRLRRGHARSGMETFTSVCAPDVDCTELARLGQAVTGLPATTATEVLWLVDGSATCAALLGDIARARRQVHLEYYIFADDHGGRQLRDARVKRARAGAMVKVVVDAVGSSTLHASFFAPLGRPAANSPGSIPSACACSRGRGSSCAATARLPSSTYTSATPAASTSPTTRTMACARMRTEAARMALTSAALGGLDVRLLVPRMSDSRMLTLAARSYHEELLAAGVRIFEYAPCACCIPRRC